MQDFLCSAQREPGPLKEGQRYWAAFALERVQALLAVRAMRRLLDDADHGADVPIESGALLLVRALHAAWLQLCMLSSMALPNLIMACQTGPDPLPRGGPVAHQRFPGRAGR